MYENNQWFAVTVCVKGEQAGSIWQKMKANHGVWQDTIKHMVFDKIKW